VTRTVKVCEPLDSSAESPPRQEVPLSLPPCPTRGRATGFR